LIAPLFKANFITKKATTSDRHVWLLPENQTERFALLLEKKLWELSQ